jgi:L-serine dehydratase
MESIKTIYKIGHGPSSSHTMGPRKAAEQFLAKYPNQQYYKVTLYGSLAATGKGHLTDVAIQSVFEEKGKIIEISWQPETFLKKHPNAMQFEAFNEKNESIVQWKAYSIGGGSIIGEVIIKKAYSTSTL